MPANVLIMNYILCIIIAMIFNESIFFSVSGESKTWILFSQMVFVSIELKRWENNKSSC